MTEMISPENLLRAPHEEAIVKEKYQVQLPQWTGPYDILLQVIEDQELNLLDLDISVLLEHYLASIQNSDLVDIEEAGEFLVVAATLAQIKSKLLLPKEDTPAEEEEKDPREDLVRYLMEYQKIKQAAALLAERPLLGRDVFIKGSRETFEGIETEGRGTLFQLVRGFQNVMRDFKAEQPMEIAREEISVSDRLKDVFHLLQERKEVDFKEILSGGVSKTWIIISFLCVLELVRLKKIRLVQSDTDAPLFLRWLEGSSDADILKSEFDDSKATDAETSSDQNIEVNA